MVVGASDYDILVESMLWQNGPGKGVNNGVATQIKSCWYCILLGPWFSAKLCKFQKNYFLTEGLREHLDHCGLTHLGIRTLKV